MTILKGKRDIIYGLETYNNNIIKFRVDMGFWNYWLWIQLIFVSAKSQKGACTDIISHLQIQPLLFSSSIMHDYNPSLALRGQFVFVAMITDKAAKLFVNPITFSISHLIYTSRRMRSSVLLRPCTYPHKLVLLIVLFLCLDE